MSYWETSSTCEAEVVPAEVWARAYADVAAWPKWNSEIKSATLNGPLARDAVARIARALPDAQRAVVGLAGG